MKLGINPSYFMKDIKEIIAKNIIDLRKNAGMTQFELAEKLNYSDKAVSKWERAESIPDVVVLCDLAKLFNVTLDYLVEEEHTKNAQPLTQDDKNNKGFITAMSTLLAFSVMLVAFIIVSYVVPDFQSWIILLYAVPVTIIVWLIFNSVWFNPKRNFLIVSLLMWGIIVSLYVSLLLFASQSVWQLFLIGIPGQIIIFFWSRLRFKKKEKTKTEKLKKEKKKKSLQ